MIGGSFQENALHTDVVPNKTFFSGIDILSPSVEAMVLR